MKAKEYYIYKNMLDACEHTNINEEMTFECTDSKNALFLFLATELAKMRLNNPIAPGEPGYNEYEDMDFFYDMWPGKKPNCAFKKRFLLAAYKLCKACPDNIFEDRQEEEPILEISLEDLKEKEYRKTEQEDIDSGTYVPVTEPKMFMGVLPENRSENRTNKRKNRHNKR